MNKSELLTLNIAAAATNIAKEANLLVEQLHNPKTSNGVLLDMAETFRPMLSHRDAFVGAYLECSNKAIDQQRVQMRLAAAEKDLDQDGIHFSSSLSRLLAQISMDAMDVVERCLANLRGAEQVVGGQLIPGSNEARIWAACADLDAMLQFAIDTYNIEPRFEA